MKNRKMILMMVLILCISLIVGCGPKQSVGEDVITLTVAGQDTEEHPNTIALHDFAKRMEEGTNGRIKMSIYPANQLGDYTSTYEEVMKGTIDMALINIPSQYNEQYDTLLMPYLTTGYDDVEKMYSVDSVVGQLYTTLTEKDNVKWMGFAMSGALGIATRKEIKDPWEFGTDKGTLLRVPPLDVFKNHLTDMGFRTVTIPYAELFIALQTGTCDGAIGTSPLSTYEALRDAINYYYLYNSTFDALNYIMNMDTFNSLKSEEQELLIKIVDEYSRQSIIMAEKTDKEYLEKMAEYGIEIVEMKHEDRQVFAEKTRIKTWPSLRAKYGEDLVDEFIKETE